jgi:CTP synthase
VHDVERLAVAGVAVDQQRQAGSADDLAHEKRHFIDSDNAKVGNSHGRRHRGARQVQRFVPPKELSSEDAREIAADVDGILLPGGSDMANVRGQILMAQAALESKTPSLGLCLGMQTMTTAVVRKAFQSSEANLAEANPSAPLKTFVPLAELSGEEHRLGDRQIEVEPNSLLGELLGRTHIIRCNHRYAFNPDLVSPLLKVGLAITAWDGVRSIVDAIELGEHPFFVGMQGHPELQSRGSFPHPVIKAFLKASMRK